MSTFEEQKKQIVDTAQALVRKGYLMATGGNISLRILEHHLDTVKIWT